MTEVDAVVVVVYAKFTPSEHMIGEVKCRLMHWSAARFKTGTLRTGVPEPSSAKEIVCAPSTDTIISQMYNEFPEAGAFTMLVFV